MASDFHPDLKDPGLYAERAPHEIFARLRREAPVYWNPETDGAGFWAITKLQDIVEISKRPDLFSSAHDHGGHRIFNENEVSVANTGDGALGIPFISLDPPLHQKYRALLVPSLSPAKLVQLESRIRQRAERLLAEIPLETPVDFVSAFAAPFPLLTLAELLGVEPELWRKLYEWTNAFVAEDDPEMRPPPEEMGRLMGEFGAFAQALYQERRETPREDLSSMMVNTLIDGKQMTFPDFLGNLVLVLVGGNETTRNSISHSICAFATMPEQWTWLRENRAQLKDALGELVRWASPVIHMRRTATQDVEIRGQPIRKGDKVVLWYLSGNRDEDAFERPDRFDVTRRGVKHVGFGAGQHVCAGSRLAELQLRIVFDLLADKVERFELLDKPRRVRSNFINGLKNVPCKLRAG